jgi:hypothetical protein
MSREDPKPGRWILPLVLAGIVGFTYVFVNSIPPAPVTATTLAPGDAAATTTTPDGPPSTTTLDPVTAAFNADVARIQTEAAELITEADGINERWDDGSLTFTASRAEFDAYQDKVADWADTVTAVVPPEPVATQWTAVTEEAENMAAAAADMFTGFIDPETSAGRRQAHDELKAAGDAIAAALTSVTAGS